MVRNVEDKEAATAIDERLFILGEVALDGEQHAGESLSVFGYLGIFVFVKAGDT